MNICSLILVFLFSFYNAPSTYTADGKASYYSDRMHGQRTYSGERYDKTKLTAAHATLPINTKVLVTNLKNGKSVVVKINDRMSRRSTILIDLSKAAAREIDIIRSGYGRVRLKVVKNDEAEQQAAPLAVSETATTSQKD